NRRHGRRDVGLFEIGARFTTATGESRGVGIAMTGLSAPEHWSGSGREVNFFDAKGAVERICDVLGVAPRFEPAGLPYCVAGQTARVLVGDAVVGVVGLVTPDIVERRGAPRHD